MKRVIKFIIRCIDNALRVLLRAEPSITGTEQFRHVCRRVMGINSNVPWPVHPSSRINGVKNITRGIRTFPGRSNGCYIQAGNGIILGNNVRIGPLVCIVSSNHDIYDFELGTESPPIKIGDNCWIGTNSVILPGVQLENHVIVGAGSVVTKSFSSNCIIAGNPARVIRTIGEYTGAKYQKNGLPVRAGIDSVKDQSHRK